jgi:Flp pilus assembly protein TadD
MAKNYLGLADETEAHINEAFRFSPRDTEAHVWLAIAGTAKFLLGRDEEAVVLFRRSIETNRNNPLAYFCLAAALAHLGRHNEARAAVQAGLVFNPSFTVTRFRAGVPSDNPTFLAQRERFYDGMRKAGVPEG